MGTPVDRISQVVISHWHGDHTGGLLSFLEYRNKFIKEKRQLDASNQRERSHQHPTQEHSQPYLWNPIVIDVHPDRPAARGIAPGPTFQKVLCALPRDPTFEEIQAFDVHSHPITSGAPSGG